MIWTIFGVFWFCRDPAQWIRCGFVQKREALPGNEKVIGLGEGKPGF